MPARSRDAFYRPESIEQARWNVLSRKDRLAALEAEYQLLASSNKNLVFKVWDSLRHIDTVRRLGMMEAISDGLVGLVAASRKYDPTRGARFCTYAWYAIRNAIIEGARRVWLIANPIYEKRGVRMGERIVALAKQARRIVPIYGPGHRGDSGDDNYEDRIGVEDDQAASLRALEIKDLAGRALGLLSSRRRQVIVLCIMQGGTYDSAAKVLGVTKQRVQQLCKSAVREMAKKLAALGATDPRG